MLQPDPGPEPQTAAATTSRCSSQAGRRDAAAEPELLVFTAQNAADGTTGSNNRAGASGDFRSPPLAATVRWRS